METALLGQQRRAGVHAASTVKVCQYTWDSYVWVSSKLSKTAIWLMPNFTASSHAVRCRSASEHRHKNTHFECVRADHLTDLGNRIIQARTSWTNDDQLLLHQILGRHIYIYPWGCWKVLSPTIIPHHDKTSEFGEEGFLIVSTFFSTRYAAACKIFVYFSLVWINPAKISQLLGTQ